ncbi:outer membrane protein [Cognatishimia sp. SS12]|uniref:outer membrane protein n=1 Tax=Cognatishimia sp. SS12 TaxID=2979465 RepID=UPI00232C1428|nr:outer membrane beta-barrel protein [Cognatishimia sp. SS12]
MRQFGFHTLTALVILATPAAAEMEISLYLGSQSLPHSNFSGDIAGTPVNRTMKLEGRSFELPPYYGARAVYWRESGWGYGLELTHAKGYASDADRAALGVDRFEFSDGHNIITANLHRRWDDLWWNGRLTPYVLGGVGVALPHVDIEPTGGAHTYGYQLTGAAMRVGAGVSIDLTDRISAFGEYQFTYSQNTVDLNGGGTINADLKTNAINLGVSYRF